MILDLIMLAICGITLILIAIVNDIKITRLKKELAGAEECKKKGHSFGMWTLSPGEVFQRRECVICGYRIERTVGNA